MKGEFAVFMLDLLLLVIGVTLVTSVAQAAFNLAPFTRWELALGLMCLWFTK